MESLEPREDDEDLKTAPVEPWRLLVWFCVAMGLVAGSATAQTRGEPGSVFERSLSGGQVDRYRVRMEAQQSLRWTIEQKGIDVRLCLFGPDGELLGDFDSPTHETGRERGLLVTDEAGDYTLEVVSVQDSSAPGVYRLAFDDWGPASDRDRHLYRGQLLLHEVNHAVRTHRDRREAWRHVETARKALGHYEAAGSRHGAVLAREILADWLMYTKSFDASLELMRETLALQAASGDESEAADEAWDPFPWMQEQSFLAETHKQIGELYLSIEAPERALGYFESARAIESRDERNDLEAVERLGLSYLALGDGEKALPLLKKLAEFWRRKRHGQKRVDALMALGSVYELLGRPHEAVRVYERCLALAQASYYRPGSVGLARMQVGRMQAAIGHWSRARESFTRAVGELEAMNQATHRVLLESAKLHQLMGQPKRAAEIYDRALAEVRALDHAKAEGAILFHLAELLRREGELDAALEATRDALEIAEADRGRVLNPNLRNSLYASDQPFFDRHVEILMERHRRSPRPGDRLEAFETSERSRARGLLEELAMAAVVGSKSDTDAREADRALRRRLDELMRPDEIAVPSSRLERRDLLNRLAEIEARRTERAALRESEPVPLSLREIRQQVLDSETALLQYHLGERTSHVWVVTTERFTVVELPARRVIESAAQELYAVLTARSERRDFESEARWSRRIAAADAAVPAAAAHLGDLLLTPIASKLDRRRLMIVGPGILQSIPFAVLPLTGDSDQAVPLVVRHEIVGAPSSSVLAALRRRAAARVATSGALAVLADPVFDASDPRIPGPRHAAATGSPASHGALRDAFRFSELASPQQLGRLPGTLDEAMAIAGLVSPEERLVAVGFDARRELALSGDLGDYRVLHFASHALLGRDFPELSGIILSLVDSRGQDVDGYLTVADIRQLEIAADLVVLSACRTALGKDMRGEGVLGLVRGFLEAGATSVVASVWSPQDTATAELMKRFYRAMLLEDDEPAAALRRAQISLWRQGWPPYFWGGFVLQGDWQGPP